MLLGLKHHSEVNTAAESWRLQAERSFLQKRQTSNLAGLEGLLTLISWFLHAELTAVKNNMIGLILLFSAQLLSSLLLIMSKRS